MQSKARGRHIGTLLRPDEDDYFILKPKHSAFFQTNLEILLGYLGATTLILAGIAGDICVLFSGVPWGILLMIALGAIFLIGQIIAN